jgi:transposase, IS30 family
MGTVEACQLVDVGRKTGYRWRPERGDLPPLRRAEPDRSSRYLSLLERQRSATLHRQRHSVACCGRRLRGVDEDERRHDPEHWIDLTDVRDIARRLGRSASTISRELRRNTAAHDVGRYDGDLAHNRARERTHSHHGSRLAIEPGLERRFSTSCSRSGVPSRSLPGYARSSRIGTGGMSATKPSIKRSTTAETVA